jgi:hypothetical protein
VAEINKVQDEFQEDDSPPRTQRPRRNSERNSFSVSASSAISSVQRFPGSIARKLDSYLPH